MMVSLARLCVVALVLLSAAGLGSALFGETVYTMTLLPSEVVNSPVVHDNSDSFGTGFCKLTRTEGAKTMFCEVEHNVNELISADIHVGARGEVGPIVFTFSQEGFLLQGQFSFEDHATYTADQLQSFFLNGLFYLNIVSLDFENGEIRGQVNHGDRFYSIMTPSQTVPRATATGGTGIAVGTYDFERNELDFQLTHSVNNPLETQVGKGKAGDAGKLQGVLSGSSPLATVFPLTTQEDEDLFLDLLFLQVTSESNPTGEIRGQLVSIDYINQPAFTALLNGQQANSGTNIEGVAVVAYDCESRLMEYIVLHDGANPTDAFVVVGELGEQAQFLFSLPNVQSPIYGTQFLLPAEAEALYSNAMGFGIFFGTNNGTDAAIRGQINSDFDKVAYLSGTNVMPAVTTSSTGLMLLREVEFSAYEYRLFYNLNETPTEVTLMLGNEGVNGGRLRTLDDIDNGSDDVLVLDDDDREALEAEETYIEIRTFEHPFGVVRGQIRNIGQCDLNIDNEITDPSNSRSNSLQSSEASFISNALTDEDDYHVIYVLAAGNQLAPSFALLACAFLAFIFV